ncbi:glycosyltransferase family 4 protein [Ichthyenterobacterium magnum]|uniref:Glycosyltransferase involved in cell wall biosynthesis n=1 Tax=Ichthyenterobacterium magnum TaxID=1230530 RepID=A0A420DLY2_9FLAO|nr:glycosyltransferase family 4 protein [Ichthyenterobacterium magnum]RKE95304.1 glycosyltransferase involved in cell wall biosynthesis [Ichthyenterobacterium magnum]
MQKLIRITTVPSSLRTLLRGQSRFMSDYYEVIGISGDGAALAEVRQNEGIKTHVVEMTRTITPLKDLKATYKLYKVLKAEKPFIVHTHTPKAGTLGMLAAKLAKVPHRLHTIAGLPLLETRGNKRKLLDVVEKLTYKCATKILPNSTGLQQIIIDNKYTKPDKLLVIGNGSSNGIDTKHYDASLVSQEKKEQLKQELGITKDHIVFIFIGRIVKDKGINELVNAFNALSKQNDAIKLLLVGPRENHLDPLLPNTETIIMKNKQIIVTGVKKDIRPYVAISHALTFPSYREGFPNVVLQCSCMNLPCIVSNINGCNEVIEDQVNGLIIPAKDESALKNAMQFIISNPEKRKDMVKHTRSRIIERYEQKYVWNEILKYYKSLK